MPVRGWNQIPGTAGVSPVPGFVPPAPWSIGGPPAPRPRPPGGRPPAPARRNHAMGDGRPALHRSRAGAYPRLKKPPSEIQVRYHYAPLWPASKPLYRWDLVLDMAWLIELV